MAFTFTGVNSRPIVAVAGATRFNTTTNAMEVFDGISWQIISDRKETMLNCVKVLEDQIAIRIDEEYADNATLHDAFKLWEEANERFKVVLALAEKQK